MSIPTEISGTILNSQTWYVSNSGTYANKLVFQSTSGTKHYYLGSNLHNDGTDRSANEIYFDTFDNKWHDSGNSNPVSFRVGTVGSETPAESSLPTSESNTGFASDVVSSGDNVIIYRGTSVQQIFSFTQPSGFYGSGATTHSTGSGNDTAKFGGASSVGVTETWTVSNGTNTGGSSYNFYLFDSTPTGTAVATLTFPLNTPAGSVLSGTFTTTEATYYIGYGDGASRVNIAQRTYPARRVPRGNFW